MAYLPLQEDAKCEWGGCKGKVSTHVTSSDDKDSAYLCSFHRKVALVNLAQFDRIHAPGNDRGAMQLRRPGSKAPPPLPRKIPKARPGQLPEEKWAQDAARKADKGASPMQPKKVEKGDDKEASGESQTFMPKISSIPTPRPER